MIEIVKTFVITKIFPNIFLKKNFFIKAFYVFKSVNFCLEFDLLMRKQKVKIKKYDQKLKPMFLIANKTNKISKNNQFFLISIFVCAFFKKG